MSLFLQGQIRMSAKLLSRDLGGAPSLSICHQLNETLSHRGREGLGWRDEEGWLGREEKITERSGKIAGEEKTVNILLKLSIEINGIESEIH